MNLLSYFLSYVKTNYFTLYLIGVLLFLSLVKYVKIGEWKIFFRRKTVLWILIIALGLSLRFLWLEISSFEPKFSWETNQALSEFDLINIHAVDLTHGIWFQDAEGNPSGRRPIGYPLFLGVLYNIFGAKASVAWIFHLILFLLTTFFIFKIAQFIFSERVGFLAAFLFSLYPISVFTVKLITDEHLLLPVFYAGIVLLLKDLKKDHLKWGWIWYGLLFGYATIIRTHPIYMPCVIAIAYFLVKRSWSRIVGIFFGTLFVMQLINLPWAIRNYKAWGVPVLYTATSCFIYHQVNSTARPEGGGHIPQRGEPDWSPRLEEALASQNPGLIHLECGREMRKWILHHPMKFLSLGIAKALLFMGWDRRGVWPIWFQYSEGAYDPSRPLPQVLRHFLEESAYISYYILFFCFIFALILWVRKKGGASSKIMMIVLLSIFAFWLFEHMIIYPDRKYRFPLEPLMIVIASYFLDYLIFIFKWEKICAFFYHWYRWSH